MTYYESGQFYVTRFIGCFMAVAKKPRFDFDWRLFRAVSKPKQAMNNGYCNGINTEV